MIKKITLASVATMALLFISAQAESMKCQAGKCGAGMMEKSKPCKGKSCDKGKSCKKGMDKKMGSPLLMPLPSAMRWIEKHTDNTTLALTAEQKTKLNAQRDKMMPEMMKFKDEIAKLTKEIKVACRKNVALEQIETDIEKLAKLKTEATMMKLTCLRGVKGTLSKEQWDILKSLQGIKKVKMKSMKKEMKCQAGKCAGK